MKEALITAAKPELETVSPNHANLPIQVACTQQKLQPKSADVPYNRQQTDGSEHNIPIRERLLNRSRNKDRELVPAEQIQLRIKSINERTARTELQENKKRGEKC